MKSVKERIKVYACTTALALGLVLTYGYILAFPFIIAWTFSQIHPDPPVHYSTTYNACETHVLCL